MTEMEAKQIIAAHKWTPRIVSRRNGRPFLYAAKRRGQKMIWCYIASVSQLDTVTKEEIISKLDRKMAASSK